MYILFEGVDGVGKSTQIELISKRYKGCLVTKEPGGTEFGKIVREILLNSNFTLSSRAEALLFLADRAELADKIISKNKDKLIISDRGFISGIAYAFANAKFNLKELIELNKFALNNQMPDKVVFFKADESLIRQRISSRGNEDTIEKRGIKYLLDVQNAMQECIKELNLNSLTIDANLKQEDIATKILEFISLKEEI